MAKKGTIGAKIVLEGEAQYRQALKNIKSAQAELRSEMKLSQSEFKGNANSMQALASKRNILTRQLEQSSKKVKVYTDAVDETTKKQEEAKRILDELKSSQTASDQEIAKAQKDYDAITNKLESYKTSLNYAQAEENEFRDELAKTDGYLAEAEHSMDGCATSIDEFGKELKDTEDDAISFGDVMKANIASEVILDSIKTLVSGIKSIAEAAIETGMQFESSMDKVAALSGATGKDLDALTEKAKDMGASTMYSASEAADALGYMALAGWDTASMLEGIEPILNLAAAADMDLAEASDIVTDYLTAFGLEAKDAAKFSDQLAYAMANSNTNVTQLGEAYKNCAATASSLGYSVEDVTAVLMTMANAGVKGGEAGTGLSSIMTRLATDTKDCASTLSEYGVEVYDAEGKMNSLSSILEGLEGIWADLTDQEQANLAKTIAGVNQYSKLQTIMKGVSESAQEGGMSFYDYSEALSQCDGSAKTMADTVQDNLKGKITILQSALDALKVSSYEAFDDSLKSGVEGATNALTRLNQSVQSGNLSVSFKKMGDALESFMNKAVDLGENALPVVVDAFAWIIDHGSIIEATLAGIAAAHLTMAAVPAIMTAITTVTEAYSLVTAQAATVTEALNLVMASNPAGAVALGISALVAAIAAATVYVTNYTTELSECAQTSEDLAQATKDFNDTTKSSIDTRAKARQDLETEGQVASDLVDRLDELQNKTKLTTKEQSEMSSIVNQLNQAYPELNLSVDENGKIIGKTTDEIRSQIDAYQKLYKVKAAQEDLTRISTDIYNAEKKQKEIEAQLGKQTEKTNVALKEAGVTREYVKGIMFDEMAYVSKETEALYSEIEAEEKLQSAYEEIANGTLKDLEAEYQNASKYIAENTDVIEESSEAQKGLEDALGDTADAYSGLSNEAKASMEELANTVADSVKNSLNAFEKFDEGTKVSKKELISNLTSQIEGVTKWSDNMKKLAARGVSDGLLDELAKLGPEGSNYVQAFVDMTDEELSDYDKNFQEYVTLPATVSNEIAESYGDTAKKGMDGMNSEIQSGGNTVQNSAQNVANKVENTFETNLTKSKFQSIGSNVAQGIAAGLNGDATASNASRNLARKIESAFKDELGIHSPSTRFKEFGQYTVQGYVEGLKKNAIDVTKTAQKLGSYAVQGIQEELVGSRLAVAASPLNIDVTHNAGSNNDIIRALNTLGSVVKNSTVNNYTVNGITYDDGSNITNAVQTLVRAAKIERRV